MYMINTLSEQELLDIKEISLKSLDFIALMKIAKNRQDLRIATKTLSDICYSQLAICKNMEMSAINLTDEVFLEEINIINTENTENRE